LTFNIDLQLKNPFATYDISIKLALY